MGVSLEWGWLSPGARHCLLGLDEEVDQQTGARGPQGHPQGARTLPSQPVWRRRGWDGTLGWWPRAGGSLISGQAPTSGTGRDNPAC